jgi:hypothetical protein
MKVIILPNHPKPPHRLAIIFPAYNAGPPGRPLGLTDDEFIQHVIEANTGRGVEIVPGSPIHIVDYDQVPSDHPCSAACEFFEAFEWVTDVVKVNMPKARIIHMDRIRVVRNEELVKLDVPFMKAAEAGDTSAQATIGTEKQALRDIPQTFDLTTDTPEELKEKWPAGLPKE